MEKTLTIINVKMVGSPKEKNLVQGKKREHVKIWREIFTDVRSQWAQAEHGRFHRS
jgi:hypothetical protein